MLVKAFLSETFKDDKELSENKSGVRRGQSPSDLLEPIRRQLRALPENPSGHERSQRSNPYNFFLSPPHPIKSTFSSLFRREFEDAWNRKSFLILSEQSEQDRCVLCDQYSKSNTVTVFPKHCKNYTLWLQNLALSRLFPTGLLLLFISPDNKPHAGQSKNNICCIRSNINT